jgi:hypothetical protein
VTARRTVRVTLDFFTQLDEQLPSQRSPRGEPTAAEFASGALMEIVEVFALEWDDLPMTHPGRPDYRTLITSKRLVPFVAVDAQLSPVDGAVELIAVAIDLTPPIQDQVADDDDE